VLRTAGVVLQLVRVHQLEVQQQHVVLLLLVVLCVLVVWYAQHAVHTTSSCSTHTQCVHAQLQLQTQVHT
jgi:hypothetical protein